VEERNLGQPITFCSGLFPSAPLRLTRRHTNALLLALLVLCAGLRPARGNDVSETTPPNLLLIVADDLGYADLGCYGGKDIQTPNLDRLARQGVRLTDFYASAPVCTPTRASLITGCYPQRFGFDWVIRYQEKDRGLAAKGASLPALLRRRGYATALFGKWHLGYKPQFSPNAHGFDEFFGFLAADLDYFAHTDANGDAGLYHNGELCAETGYLTDLITEHALAFLKQTRDQPLFLEVAYNAPHWPFQAPDNPADRRTVKTYGPEKGTRRDYVGMVERMDQGIGKLLRALEETGRAKNTLIIFLSDNGGERLSDNGSLFHGKYTLWEGGIRVPCLLRWPGVLPPQAVSREPVIAMDLTASLLAAAGAALPANACLDGDNVLPMLSGKEPSRERTFCWRLPRPDAKYGQKAVRRGRWKYVYDREMDLLFDLEQDPGERHNLAYQRPETIRGLRMALARWESQLPPITH
jgi:arylsulfatase A-like enzyme